MTRIELNLWDAQTFELYENVLTIETGHVQIKIMLPTDWNLGMLKKEKPEEPIVIYPEGCTHPPLTHKIDGGCYAPDCDCGKSRNSEPCDGSVSIDAYKELARDE